MPQSMIKLIRYADIISIINATCGFLAVVVLLLKTGFSEEIQIRISVTLIFLGLLADGLDGIIARKKGKGLLGEYIESMADMSSMIIAPVLIILFKYQVLVSYSLYLLYLLLFAIVLYVVCGLIRLAAFHPLKHQKTFTGLPASAATIILLLVAIFYGNYMYMLLIIVIVSIMMILPISYPKPKDKMNAIAAFLIFFSLLLWDSYYTIGPLILLISLVLYIFLGPLLQRKEHKSKN